MRIKLGKMHILVMCCLILNVMSYGEFAQGEVMAFPEIDVCVMDEPITTGVCISKQGRLTDGVWNQEFTYEIPITKPILGFTNNLIVVCDSGKIVRKMMLSDYVTINPLVDDFRDVVVDKFFQMYNRFTNECHLSANCKETNNSRVNLKKRVTNDNVISQEFKFRNIRADLLATFRERDIEGRRNVISWKVSLRSLKPKPMLMYNELSRKKSEIIKDDMGCLAGFRLGEIRPPFDNGGKGYIVPKVLVTPFFNCPKYYYTTTNKQRVWAIVFCDSGEVTSKTPKDTALALFRNYQTAVVDWFKLDEDYKDFRMLQGNEEINFRTNHATIEISQTFCFGAGMLSVSVRLTKSSLDQSVLWTVSIRAWDYKMLKDDNN